MTTKTITVNGVECDVVSSSRGWIKYMDANGSIRSMRGNGNTKAAKPAGKARAVVAKSSKPAKAAKAAAPKATGVRTIGATTADVSKYERVKTAAGNTSLDNGDKTAKALRDMTLDKVYTECARACKEDLEATTIAEAEALLRKKYGKLNVGMQRMNLGNRIRAAARAA